MAKEKLTFIRGAQASNVAGTIWFDTDAKVIKVGDGTNWDIFDGKIKDASFVDGILTIEKYGEGVAPVVLNLSSLASAEAVANAFVEAHNKIKANAADIKTIQAELKSLSSGDSSIATQIDNAIKALDVEDTVVEGQYVSGVSETDGKITVTRAALPDYTEVYDAKGDAAKAEAAAKKYADDTFQAKGNYETAGTAASLIEELDLPNTYEAKGAAEDALDAAKTYADGLVMVDGVAKFDAAGAAATAEANAKAYVDGIVNDTTGEDGAVTKGLNSRIATLEAIDHKKLADDASAAAVATVLDGAPEKFDTLKEVAQWIADSETAADAADLVTRVKALEDIDHDAYVAADETVLASAKSYADGLVMDGETPRFDAKGAAAQALVDAKAYVDPKFQAVDTKIGTVPEGKDVVTMISDAKTAAETAANGYTDGKIAEITAAETGILAQAKAYADSQDEVALAAANKHTDDALAALVGKDGQVGKNTAAIAVLNGDAKTAGSVAKALADAKKYTDEVFMWAEF